MLIEIHMIQNHSPANLNRDDLGAPKTCFFGGVLRLRISSQCIKRSIRLSEEFELLCGSIRTRKLAKYLAEIIGNDDALPLAQKVLEKCGLNRDESQATKGDKKDVIVFVSKSAAEKMAELLEENMEKAADKQIGLLASQFAKLIAEDCYAPDMALSGRMLEPAKAKKSKKDDDEKDSKESGVWQGLALNVEAALQVAHAISTHEARPEVDYFVAADDVKGEDAGGAHIGEALYSSACFYKYFAINWDLLVANLNGNAELAAHTVGAFIRGAAQTTPSGKQNSFAAHNLPDGILVEIKDKSPTPTNYANAFAAPVPTIGPRDVILESIVRLASYARDLDVGYGLEKKRLWFSPNNRYPLAVIEEGKEISLTDENCKSVGELVESVIKGIGHDWKAVQKCVVNLQVAS